MDKRLITAVLAAAGLLTVIAAGIIIYRLNPVVAAEDAPLVNSYWAVVEMDGKKFVMHENMAREPHMVLRIDDHRLSGFSGCNTIMGRYALDGETLTFPDGIAMTRMACPVGMETERAFSDVLQRTTTWSIKGETLSLLDEDGAVIGVFERRLMP